MPQTGFPTPAQPIATARLDFVHHDELGHVIDEPMRNDISVLEQHERTLWLASDETVTVERLIEIEPGRYGAHESFSLRTWFDLPDEGEADLEGLAVDSGYLWVVGSHALKRKRPKPEEKGREKALERLETVVAEPNRYLLARIPMTRTDREGVFGLAAQGTEADGGPAVVKMRKGRNKLYEALADDVHIGRFLEIPAKENGFDVEGLAVRGDRIFLGLRGPVLRGWATILELSVTAKNGKLKLRKIGPEGQRYRKHFLGLAGLGVRELHFDGDDLLILAGPTMDLDGPTRVYRWRRPLAAENELIIPASDVEHVLELPFGDGTDHAEGIALAPTADERRLLVTYDSPDPSRLHPNERTIDADVFALD